MRGEAQVCAFVRVNFNVVYFSTKVLSAKKFESSFRSLPLLVLSASLAASAEKPSRWFAELLLQEVCCILPQIQKQTAARVQEKCLTVGPPAAKGVFLFGVVFGVPSLLLLLF